jgi:putative peptidoglycan lipid II flippase
VSLESTGLGLAILRAINAGLGLVLSIGLAIVFGVSRETDALFVAMAVAVFLGRDLSRVIRTAAVPCLVESNETRGSPEFTSALLGAVALMAAAGAALVWCAAPLIARMTSPGFDAAALRDAERLLRLLAPSLLFFFLFGSAQGVFHAHRRFLVPELGETLWRAFAIVSLLVLGRRWGVEAYAAGLTLAAVLQWTLLFAIGARSGLRVLPARWAPVSPRLLRPFWMGAIVVLCCVTQMQAEGVLDRAFMSFMPPGSIALFTYAQRLAHMMPLLLSTSLLTPWLPEMTRIRARVDDPRRLAKQGSLFLAALGALLGAVIAWAAPDATRILLLHGEFNAPAAAVVSATIRAFALGIPAIFCIQCLAGLYIVERDLKAMIRVSVLAVAAHAVGNVALRHWGVPGMALSGSLTAWIVALYLWQRIRAREPVWFAWTRFAVALAAVGALLAGVPWTSWVPWTLVRLSVGALASGIVYTAVMWPAIRRMQAYERAATQPEGPR